MNVGENLLQTAAESSAFVVGGDDDAVLRRQEKFSVLSCQFSAKALEAAPDQDFAIVFGSCDSGNALGHAIKGDGETMKGRNKDCDLAPWLLAKDKHIQN